MENQRVSIQNPQIQTANSLFELIIEIQETKAKKFKQSKKKADTLKNQTILLKQLRKSNS